MYKLSHVFLITTQPQALPNGDRRLRVGNINTTVVSEYDFRQIPSEQLYRLYDARSFLTQYGQLPTAGQIGCAAAHRYCYESLLREDGTCALIMEDDIEFLTDIYALVSKINSLDIVYDVINLKITMGFFRRDPVAIIPEGQVFRATLFQPGAHAYLIQSECAKRFLQRQQPKLRRFADWPLDASRMRCFGLKTDLIKLSGRQSTTATGVIPSHKSIVANVLHNCRLMQWKLMAFYRLHLCNDIVF
jgi:GR25 family glycosyltransferase involved in LPS biosynthesis